VRSTVTLSEPPYLSTVLPTAGPMHHLLPDYSRNLFDLRSAALVLSMYGRDDVKVDYSLVCSPKANDYRTHNKIRWGVLK